MALSILNLAFLLLISSYTMINSHKIEDEMDYHHKVDMNVLQKYIDQFNTWHSTNTPNNRVEVRRRSDGRLGVFAKVDIKEGENMFEYPSEFAIDVDNVNSNFIGEIIKELETKFGYSPYAHFLFSILYEKHQGDKSKWYSFFGKT